MYLEVCVTWSLTIQQRDQHHEPAALLSFALIRISLKAVLEQ